MRVTNIQHFLNSRFQMFFKIGVLKNFEIFTGKHLRWCLFFSKQTPTQLYLSWLLPFFQRYNNKIYMRMLTQKLHLAKTKLNKHCHQKYIYLLLLLILSNIHACHFLPVTIFFLLIGLY